MTPYDALADATLAHGVMPAWCRSSSRSRSAARSPAWASRPRRSGTAWCTRRCSSWTCSSATARVVAARPDNEHRDLFFGFPNSYGTLGYALRVKARTVPVKPFVRLEHLPFATPEALLRQLAASLRSARADFVDGVVFGPHEMVPDGRPVRRRGALHQRLHLRAHLLPLDLREPRRGLPQRRATTSGAGTPTGSGARRTWARRIRWCGGCSAEAPRLDALLHEGDALEQPRRRSRSCSTGCSAGIPSR